MPESDVQAALSMIEASPEAAFAGLRACVDAEEEPIWIGAIVLDWLEGGAERWEAWWGSGQRKAVVVRLFERIRETWMKPMTGDHVDRLALEKEPRRRLARALRFVGEHEGVDFFGDSNSATFWFGLALQLEPDDDDALRGYILCVLEQGTFNRGFSLEAAARRTQGERRAALLLAHAACEHVVLFDLGEAVDSAAGGMVRAATRMAIDEGATRDTWSQLVALLHVRDAPMQLDESWFDQWVRCQP